MGISYLEHWSIAGMAVMQIHAVRDRTMHHCIECHRLALMSVCAGVQLAKMTPFRSAVVMAYTAVSITILSLLQLKGGVITYVIVSLRYPAQHTP